MAARATGTKKASAKKAAEAAPDTTGRGFWLVKSEPDVFSFDDLMKAKNRTTFWDGVRNYQARNFLRDSMKPGDGVLVYHSNAEPPGIAGVATVARAGYPDPTQFDAKEDHYDPAAKKDAPIWYVVDIQGVAPLARYLPLPELKEQAELDGMLLLKKGMRLSVQPVSEAHWKAVLALGGRPELA